MLRFNGFWKWNTMLGIWNFNTSYVTVQPWKITVLKFVHSISIHPMLRFNICTGRMCIMKKHISIHPMLRFNVQFLLIILFVFYFNTSYVTVQLVVKLMFYKFFSFQYILCYGSTEIPFKKMEGFFVFQYILCYGSTSLALLTARRKVHFNTSYVTVQQLHRWV